MGAPFRYTSDGCLVSERSEQESEHARCDWCGAEIRGRPAASGLLLWTRGDEVRYEEPPLCERCAGTIGFGSHVEEFEDE